MPITRALKKACWVTRNNDVEKIYCKGKWSAYLYNPWKLHININPAYFDKIKGLLNATLDEATEDKTIDGFKVVDFERLAETIYRDDERAKNIPYTLYLFDADSDEYLTRVLLLCVKIEKILQNIPSGQMRALSVADIPLSTHLVFRQAAMEKGEYIPSDDKRATELGEAGRKSKPFLFLASRLALAPLDSAGFATQALSIHQRMPHSLSNPEKTERKITWHETKTPEIRIRMKEDDAKKDKSDINPGQALARADRARAKKIILQADPRSEATNAAEMIDCIAEFFYQNTKNNINNTSISDKEIVRFITLGIESCCFNFFTSTKLSFNEEGLRKALHILNASHAPLSPESNITPLK